MLESERGNCMEGLHTDVSKLQGGSWSWNFDARIASCQAKSRCRFVQPDSEV
jgi:hypothetical protein